MPVPNGPPSSKKPQLVNRGAAGLYGKLKPADKAALKPGEVVVQPEKAHAKHRIAPALQHMATPIDQLIPDPVNARLHPERNMESIKQSLLAYGQVKPIVVRKQTMVVVAGNGTLAAAKELGWPDVAAVLVDHFDDAAAAGYGLADNRTAELAKWDFEIVAKIDKMLLEAGHNSIGWSDDELEVLRAAEWTPPEATDSNFVHVGENSGNEEWYTPEKYINAARAVLGSIDLDPASCDEAQKVVKAKTFYSQEDDGLIQPWFGNVWMNPPYSGGKVDLFIKRLIEFYQQNEVIGAIVLTNNATDTEWFHLITEVSAAICLVAGRIKFHTANSDDSSTPSQGQLFFYLGDNADKFNEVFSSFGTVMIRFQGV